MPFSQTGPFSLHATRVRIQSTLSSWLPRWLKSTKSCWYVQYGPSVERVSIRRPVLFVGMISALGLLYGFAPSARAIPIGNEISACVPGTCPTGSATYPTVGVCAAPVFRDNGYGIYTGGNFTITNGAESEGRHYISGDLIMNKAGLFNMVEVGVGACVVPVNSNAAGGVPHVIVGGNLQRNAGNLSVGQPSLVSNVVVAGAVTGAGALTTSGVVTAGATIPPPPESFASLATKSTFWATQSANGTVVDDGFGGVTLNGDNTSALQVFNITVPGTGVWGPSFGNVVSFRNIPANATVLINVPAAGALRLNTSDFTDTANVGGFGFSSDLNRRILWNFPNASFVEFAGGAQWRGSALVANGNAKLNLPGFNGRMIVKGNLEQNCAGCEFHNYDFKGDLPAPVAATCSLVLAPVTPGACTFATATGSTYGVTVNFTYTNPPATETINVAVTGATAQSIAQPGTSAAFTGLTADGLTKTVTAAFSGGTCSAANITFTAPSACAPPTFSLGNRVWYDTNNNGILDAGEAPIPGVVVDLLNGTGQKLYRTSGGAIVTTAAGNTAIEATTDANGYYRLDSLPAGTYAARVTAANWTPATGVLAGYANSSFAGTGAVTGAGDPNGTTAVNNTDKGIDDATPATGGITSRNVTLGTGLQPTGEDAGATGAGAAGPTGDANDNRTVDFGFYRLSVGNLIWRDDGTGGGTANNGTRDGTEPGIDGVRVELFDSTNTVVAVTTTAGGGLYNFTQKTDATGALNGNPLIPGNYTVRVPGGQTPLSGFTSSTDPAGGATPLSADNDDNGTGTSATTGATSTSAFALAAGTNAATGAVGTNATGATDQPRVDLGFVPAPSNFSIGNRIFSDPNNSGRQDSGELGIANVQVRLLDSAGVPLSGGSAQTTDANGYYRFDNLPAGTYIVEVVGSTLPAGAVSSTGTQAGDQGDKGADVPVAGNYRSAPVTLGTGLQPTGETDLSGTGQGAQGLGGDANTNSTIDFGFVPPTYSIGNRVWRDTNNDGLRAPTGEPGIDGVAMTLYRADASGNPTGAPVATTTTAAGGYYRFDNLQAGDYVVIVDAANFATGAPLKTLASSTNTQANANSDTDNDDNGIDAANPAASGIRSGRVAVGPGAGEPVGEADLVGGANPQGPSPDNQANMSVDFGFYPLASLGDKVFLDTNANGIQDAGEGGVPGVTVKLLDGAGNPVTDPATGLPRTTTSDGNGNYSFTNLPVGSYQVEFVPPAGYSISPKDQGGNDATDSDIDPTTKRTAVVTLAPDENNPTLDAGLFFTAALGDRVWHDLNKNGIQDAGEPGVSGVTVTLINSTTGATVSTTTTDGSGNYNFSGLTPGVPYVVEFSNLPAGYQFTTKGPGASTSDPADSDADTTTGRTDPITLVSGQNDPNWDAGIFGPIDLTLGKAVAPVAPASGSPYLTGDQVEYTLTVANLGPATALAGYTVTDLLPAGLTSPTVVSSAGFTPCALAGSTLSCTGSANLLAGAGNALTIKYRATISAAAGTIKNIAYVDKAASDPSAETNPLGAPPTPATNASASPTNNDADTSIVVNATTYSLGNRVWVDTNNNGTIDAGELGRDGVTVELIDSTGAVIAATTTANGGYYRFDNLSAGDYVVHIAASNFVSPGVLQGYTSSGPTETTPNSDADSNDNGLNTPVGGAIRSGTVTLGPGAAEPTGETDVASPNPAGEAPDARSNLTVDFGFVPPASLGNFVFNDTNGNGIQDAGEAGVPGVTVTLLDDAGNAVPGVPPQITDGSGNYLFTNLPPGTYIVSFSNLPAGTVFTGQNLGGNDATDSDVNPANGRSDPVALAAGETNLTVDAGVRPQAGVTVGNFVWRDNNANGIQDAGEPGVAGVIATISRVGGGAVTDVSGNPVTTTTTTDTTGAYQFANLAPGQYTVTFSTLPAGFTPTTTNAPGSTTANDSNGLTATSTVLAAGQSDLTLDLGLIPPATPTFSIGNRVFADTNGDGRQGTGESGIPGVQVRLLDSAGTPVTGFATQTTDAGGYYRFDNLPAGTYILEVVGSTLPVGVTGSPNTQPGDQGDKGGPVDAFGNYRSDPVQVGTGLQPTGESDLTATGPGAQGPGGDANTNSIIDFGFLSASGGTATIVGTVFADPDRDGAKAPTEGGVPLGTVVQLLDPVTNVVIATTTTDASGNYTFANLPAGTYNVVVPTPPNGTSATTPVVRTVTAISGQTIAAPVIGFAAAFDGLQAAIPTLSEWAMLLMAITLMLFGVGALRRRV